MKLGRKDVGALNAVVNNRYASVRIKKSLHDVPAYLHILHHTVLLQTLIYGKGTRTLVEEQKWRMRAVKTD